MNGYKELSENEFNHLKKNMAENPGSAYYQFVMSCVGYEFYIRWNKCKLYLFEVHDSFSTSEIEQIKSGIHEYYGYRLKIED